MERTFGRTALEATSRGCATIISNRGGLIETSDHVVILKKLDSINLYREIKNLIINSKKEKKFKLNVELMLSI